MPSIDDYVRELRRSTKNAAINTEIRQRFLEHRDAMLASFSGLTVQEKLQAFQEISALMSAKISGF